MLDGDDVTARPPFARDVNTVFQDYALFPHMDVARQRRVRPAGEEGARVAAPGPRHGGAGVRAAGQLRRPPADPALRRAAPARGARAGAGQPAQGAAARRAARRPGPQAPPGDAARAQAAAARGRHHLRVRDARPGGGADDERPDRRLQRRPHRAGRDAPPSSTRTPAPRSSPASWAPPTCSPARRRRPCSAATGTFSIRPEKIHLDADVESRQHDRPAGPWPTSSTSARSTTTSSSSTPAPPSPCCSRTSGHSTDRGDGEPPRPAGHRRLGRGARHRPLGPHRARRQSQP